MGELAQTLVTVHCKGIQLTVVIRAGDHPVLEGGADRFKRGREVALLQEDFALAQQDDALIPTYIRFADRLDSLDPEVPVIKCGVAHNKSTIFR